jgi:AbrB family looped-hinge helix DNA binding protein
VRGSRFQRIGALAVTTLAPGGLANAIFDGNLYGMKTTIDAAGRVVVPKKIRESAQLEAGSELEVRLENGVIELEPVAARVKFKKKGHFVVAQLDGKPALLTQNTVKATVDSVRRERMAPAAGRKRRV